MHEICTVSRTTDKGKRQPATRRVVVWVLLASAVLLNLTPPVSVSGAHLSLTIGPAQSAFSVRVADRICHAAGTTELHHRALPVTATAGEEFEVMVTFTAPADGFHAIGLTDMVPAGWKVSVDLAWTEPQAILAHTPEPEEVVYIWMGPFAAGVNFTAVYRVMVPVGAMPGTYAFGGSLEYYVEPFPAPSHWATPAGDLQVQVVDATAATTGRIVGVIGEVDGTSVPGASVVLHRDGEVVASAVSDQSGAYSLEVPRFGDYEVLVRKPGFRDEAQPISVTEPAAGALDFAGDRGLIPNAPGKPYVLACAALWQLDDPSLQLSTSRLLDVISAAKYPAG